MARTEASAIFSSSELFEQLLFDRRTNNEVGDRAEVGEKVSTISPPEVVESC